MKLDPQTTRISRPDATGSQAPGLRTCRACPNQARCPDARPDGSPADAAGWNTMQPPTPNLSVPGN